MLKDEAVTIEQVRQIVREEVERAFKKDPAAKRACIIASKGTLDWAYPPLILSTAAAAAGMAVAVFFTFYGLNIIRKDFERGSRSRRSLIRRCRCPCRCPTSSPRCRA